MSEAEIMRQIQEAYMKRQLEEELGSLDTTLDEKLINAKRDSMGRFVENDSRSNLFPSNGMKEGWYQDSKGSLYHYDGSIWDEVPSSSVRQLEYLGV